MRFVPDRAKPCRSCDAPIFFARPHTNPAGKSMPINAEPVEGGNIRVVDRPRGVEYEVLRDIDAAKISEPLFVSHFATCPQARDWRSR